MVLSLLIQNFPRNQIKLWQRFFYWANYDIWYEHHTNIQKLFVFCMECKSAQNSCKCHLQTISLLFLCVYLQVQDIVLSLFVQRTLPAEIRMMACMVLLETKPSIALISVISEVLLEENDLHVASFTYSVLRGIANSRTPDNQQL